MPLKLSDLEKLPAKAVPDADAPVETKQPLNLAEQGEPNDKRKELAQKLSAQCARLGYARDNKKAFFNVFYNLAIEEQKLPANEQVHGYANAATEYNSVGLNQLYTMARKCWPLDKRSALAILAGDPFTEKVDSLKSDIKREEPEPEIFDPPPLYAVEKSLREVVYDIFLSQEFNESDTVHSLVEYLERELPQNKLNFLQSAMLAPKLLQLRIEHDCSISDLNRLLLDVDWIEEVLTKGPSSFGEFPVLVPY